MRKDCTHRFLRLVALASVLGAVFGGASPSFAGHTCSSTSTPTSGAQVCDVTNTFTTQGVTTRWRPPLPKMQSYFEVFLCDSSGCFQRLGSGWSTTQAELGWTVPACLREGSYLTRVQVFESTTGTWDGMPSAPFKLGPSPHACIWDAWVDYSELRQGFYQQIRWTSQNQAGVALYVHKQSGNSWVPMDMRPYGGGADGWVFSANTNIQSAQWLVPQTFPPGWYAFWVKTWNSAGPPRSATRATPSTSCPRCASAPSPRRRPRSMRAPR